MDQLKNIILSKENLEEIVFKRKSILAPCLNENEKLHSNTDTTESHNTENIDEIQKQRGSIYGSYTNNIIAREKIFNALREHNSNTPEGFNSFLQDVISKLVRLNNCPTHKDSIIDLKSYVDLWLKHVKGE